MLTYFAWHKKPGARPGEFEKVRNQLLTPVSHKTGEDAGCSAWGCDKSDRNPCGVRALTEAVMSYSV
ncbi:MAG: hypothetical protein EKK29_01320 [Hyphomicrobiales bacterium]|nr:MAG: hypothetical protein EKK29_01320 [Hyphomicrobiales bacterium]